jgi:Zn-dependent protease with chaperone function
MKSFVLRNKGPDRTWAWLLAFALAFVATLVASSYVICVLLRVYHWLDDDLPASWIFVVPWYWWVPMTGFVAWVTLWYRNWSTVVGNPSRRMYTLLSLVGASRVSEDTRDLLERRLININEETAIAAGCIPADVYVLQKDYSINALTIGSSEVAAIVVTRGGLRTLKRAELQAVVAHEYGHVVNNDVWRNTKLLYWLGALLPHDPDMDRWRFWRLYTSFGFVSVVAFGFAMLFQQLRGAFGAIAAVFWLVASICGVIFAGMTFNLVVTRVWREGTNATRAAHAGFTREREFEADAVSAQLTREPQALATVLRKIAGLRTESSLSPRHATMLSHLCIASGLFGTEKDRFATHPSLEERLKALGHPLTPDERKQLEEDPADAVERYAAEVNAELGILYATEPLIDPQHFEAPEVAVAEPVETASAEVDAPFVATPDIGHAIHLLSQFPSEVRAALRTHDGAWAAAHALISDHIPPDATPERQRLVHLFSSTLADLGERHRLPLLELASPSLRDLPLADRRKLYTSLRMQMESAVSATLREFVYFTLLARPLQDSRGHPSHLNNSHCFAVLLGAAAYAFAPTDAEAAAAFASGRKVLPTTGDMPSRKDVAWTRLERVLDRLRLIGPRREMALKGLAAVISHDGRIEVSEVELLRAVALAIDWPMPPLAADPAPAS